MKYLEGIIFAYFLLCIFLFPVKAYAVIICNISTTQASINQDQSLNVDVSFTGLSASTTYYLQSRMKLSSSSNYFGLTQDNKANFYQYSSDLTPDTIKSSFFSFTTDDMGNWDGIITAKPDVDDPDYKGSGEYIVQVLRYTGNSKSESGVSNDLEFTINDVRLTSTPTPFPTSTPTPTSKPTKVPTPTSIPKDTPTITISQKIISPTDSLLAKQDSSFDIPQVTKEVLGTQSQQNNTKVDPPVKKQNLWSKIFIVIGVILVSIPCGILAYKKYREEKEIDSL